ncbi:hypothetical protein KW404_21530, partial [Xanthomonas vasicola pv. vasculorum]|uniref:hypothetical protein n=1 Tax=Xanthomonas vasicola TaxID=56459 RepID=UPI001C4411ED
MLVSKAMRGAGGLQCISLHCLQNYVISNAPCECVENVRSRPLRNVRRGQTPLRDGLINATGKRSNRIRRAEGAQIA